MGQKSTMHKGIAPLSLETRRYCEIMSKKCLPLPVDYGIMSQLKSFGWGCLVLKQPLVLCELSYDLVLLIHL
jgi:hypothetical protein